MPFSKFDPDREEEADPLAASSPSAARRARVLRWVNWVVLVYTAIGFGFVVYWLAEGR